MPLVVTVHDLARAAASRGVQPLDARLLARAVPRVVRAASRVIAVSEFTQRELVELLRRARREDPRRAERGRATPFTPEGQRAEGDYVLAVGTLEPRKNLPRLVEAARRLGVRAARRRRAAAGAASRPAATASAGSARSTTRSWRALYRGALCVVYPSLYEGFGIPVLEAHGAAARRS